MEYNEGEIRLAALVALNASSTGTLTTSQLISRLAAFMHPKGTDAQIATGRADTYFSQKVRNLISHRDSGTSLVSHGYVTYDEARESMTITTAGRAAAQI